MTTKAWSHLPNATHIDWVLETLEKDSEMWDIAWDAAWDDAWDDAYKAAWDATKNAVCDDAWGVAWGVAWRAVLDAAWDDAWGVARTAARGSIAALIAWDDSSKLLDMQVEEVTELATQGNHAAVLLLPAVIVKNKLKEKNA